MASERQLKGYIYGEQILKYAHISHYERAMNSSDMKQEEYWYQSVFHGPGHSQSLTKEIYHKKIRNGVTNKVEVETLVSSSNADIVNGIKAEERRNDVLYTRVVEDQKVVNVSDYLPDTKVGFSIMLKELIEMCRQDEIKVLAYYICTEGLDKVLSETEGLYATMDDLSTAINGIWEKNVKSINDLNKFVGTRARAEKARWRLLNHIRNHFPELLAGKR